MTNYETNSARLDQANDEIREWAKYRDPEDAERDIRNHLLGALMARVDPDTFDMLVKRAEWFAGRPHDEDTDR